MFESRISARATEKYLGEKSLTQRRLRGPMTWKGMLENAFEGYCELATKNVEQIYKVSSPCLDDHQFKQEELESVGELSQVCPNIVLKCLYLARIGRPDRHSTVCEQTCRSSHQMDQSL